HGDAVVNADGVEDERDAAGFAHEAFDEHADLVEVGVAGDAIGVGIADGNERLVPVGLGFDGTGRAEQRAVRRAFKALFDDVGAHSHLRFTIGNLRDLRDLRDFRYDLNVATKG